LCETERTEKGYKVHLRVRLNKKLSDIEKMGFEIMGHDFNQKGEYIATRYWNALKFSAVSIRPDYYGVLKIKR